MSKSESKSFRGVTGRTPNQKNLIQTVNEKEFTLLSGVYGSGKTFICVGLACEYLKKGKVDKIVFVRNGNGAIKELGYTSGSWKDKNLAMFDQVVEYFISFLGTAEFNKLYEQGVIELTSTSLLRGRNFATAFIVLEEAQLCDRDDMILFVSRVDKGSKVIIAGDEYQIHPGSFFENMMNNFEDEAVGVCRLTEEDIQRNKHMARICNKLKNL